MRNSLRAVVIAMALLLVPAAGRASTILYQATSLGGATWQYDYFLGAGTAFLTQQGFQIYFDGDYSNLLLLPPTPVDWDVLVTQWDPMLSSGGTCDAMATADNPLFTGPFSVSFTWLGAGAPGSQPFAIYADGLATPLEFIERGDTASEVGAHAGVFRFTRSGSTTSGLTVSYTIAGTAINGTDYATIGGSIGIPAGLAFADLAITPIDDGSPEPAETVILTITDALAYDPAPAPSAAVTIRQLAGRQRQRDRFRSVRERTGHGHLRRDSHRQHGGDVDGELHRRRDGGCRLRLPQSGHERHDSGWRDDRVSGGDADSGRRHRRE